ncbi:hypothetical protein Vadar_025234 [Vaccinium darrowii]|uniref:Uncharacterized protein n=1 Tax=Vaccinium darrowii TaxID=229202 RepID=A0ACB7Z669_9ERIC|nr:hypothetical protein Vadar_025234 [Vaccinium darrowii]
MVRTTRSGPINGDASGSGDQQLQQPDIMNQFAQLLQNLTATVQPPQPRGPPPRCSIFSEFRRQQPPIFSCEPDPQVANRWIRQIKKMLETMDVWANNDKIALATYQIEDEVDHWWEAIKGTLPANLTWDHYFETIFLEKYFPSPVKQALVQEFLSLKQGTMTVTQYMARFEELLRHASEYIPTDEKKARQFEWGLDLTLRERVISNQQKTTLGGPIRNNNNKAFVNKKPYDNRPQNQTWGNRNTARGNQQQQWKSVDQYGNVRVCFKCGQEGHIASFCPQAGTRNQGLTEYYEHGQGSSGQRSQLPTQQQQFN